MKIAVLAFTDAVMSSVADITFPVMRKYCMKHSFDFHPVTWRLSDRRIVWDKLKLAQIYLPQADWIIVIDCDVMIMNHTINFEKAFLTPTLKNFVVGTDINGLNLGVFALWNCQWSIDMLDRAWDIKEHEVGSEQEAIMKACAGHMENVLHMPQRKFNSYDWASYGESSFKDGQYEDGDFALHLPGHTAEKRVEIFNKYLDRIIYV